MILNVCINLPKESFSPMRIVVPILTQKKEALILFLKTRNFEFMNNLFRFLNPIFNIVWNPSL
jgi:hypothetical protein